MYEMSTEDEDFLLKLLNTTPTASGVRQDLLADESRGRAWLKELGGQGTRNEWLRITAVRDTLQRATRGELNADDELQVFLSSATSKPVIHGGEISWVLDGHSDELLGVRSVLAWSSFGAGPRSRLRACANEECSLFLIDRSNANRAQWCSMAVCGNRMKARRHYQHSRKMAGDRH